MDRRLMLGLAIAVLGARRAPARADAFRLELLRATTMADRFATTAPPRDMRVVTGDFDGDGRVDLAAIAPDAADTGVELLVALATDAAAPLAPWRHAPGLRARDIHVVAGDFNGDARCDLGLVADNANHTSVDLYVALSTGARFDELANWRHAEGYGWTSVRPVAGDFNGDGRVDLAAIARGIAPNSIDLLVATSTGASFDAIANWRHVDGVAWPRARPIAGDFDADGRTDLGALIDADDSRALLVAPSAGASFAPLAPWRR